MTETRPAEMHPAYVWDCDHCGTENFVRSVVYEPSIEERTELATAHGVSPDEIGDWVSHPDEVTCSRCGTTYPAKHFRSEQDDSHLSHG